jgi:hypothetical protein
LSHFGTVKSVVWNFVIFEDSFYNEKSIIKLVEFEGIRVLKIDSQFSMSTRASCLGVSQKNGTNG